MKDSSAAALIALMTNAGYPPTVYRGNRGRHPYNKARPCLQCGTPHTSNNAWCSADCCKAWRRHKKKEADVPSKRVFVKRSP